MHMHISTQRRYNGGARIGCVGGGAHANSVLLRQHTAAPGRVPGVRSECACHVNNKTKTTYKNKLVFQVLLYSSSPPTASSAAVASNVRTCMCVCVRVHVCVCVHERAFKSAYGHQHRRRCGPICTRLRAVCFQIHSPDRTRPCA